MMAPSFIDQLAIWVDSVAALIWTYMVPVLFGVGLLLTFRVRFLQFIRLGTALRITFSKRSRSKGGREGDVTPFAALATALAATVGNGNIAGVATALFWGGPGAIFWMWICGLLGMATKYSEAVLGVQFRRKHPDGTIAGGPMYYIRYGLGDSSFSRLLAGLFAVCGAFAALFGTGNMMQSNAMSTAFRSEFGVPPLVTGIVITVFVALVVLGGIKRIGAVASRLVPTMLVVYFAFGLIVLAANITLIPQAFLLIFEYAFTPAAAAGGFLGATVRQALQFGARRGILSNEAGLGSAPIAHAAAQTPGPIYQGLIGVAEVFIDTIVVCTFTAIILLSSGVWTSGAEGAAMTATAFSATIPYIGGGVVAAASFLFGYSTLLGWCYYGEQCLKYLFGIRITMIYRLIFISLTFVGSVVSIEIVFFIGDIANAFMALPNLIGLMLLSGLVSRITKEALKKDPVLSE
jgi:alanine or glycine:cation symporter, AGCS family